MTKVIIAQFDIDLDPDLVPIGESQSFPINPNKAPKNIDIPLADDDPIDAPVPNQAADQEKPIFTPEEYEEILPEIHQQPKEPDEAEEIIEENPEEVIEENPEEVEEAPFSEDEYEEIIPPSDKLDELNRTLTIEDKITMSMTEGYPLRIVYRTLKGNVTERTIEPDYYRPARTTGNWILIAWDWLRNDWRGFITSPNSSNAGIMGAKLEPINA